jgi:hypothetical protein
LSVTADVATLSYVAHYYKQPSTPDLAPDSVSMKVCDRFHFDLLLPLIILTIDVIGRGKGEIALQYFFV